MSVLLNNWKKFEFTPKTLCQLFDSFEASILGYSFEIWGCCKTKKIEKIHLKFCKRVLKVQNNTSKVGVYGELGRYPLFISRCVRIIKDWCNVNVISTNSYV